MRITLRFILNTKRRSADDLCSISLRIIYLKKQAFLPTGISVLQSQFDDKESKRGGFAVVKDHIRETDYNGQLRKIQSDTLDVIEALRHQNDSFTVKTIKQKLENHGLNAVETFRIVLEEDRRIVKNTKQAIKSMFSRLEQFQKNITLDEINYAFAKRFERWLLSQPSRNGGTLSINSTNKYIRDLSRMLSRCKKYEYVKTNKLEGYDHIIEKRTNIKKTNHLTFKDLEFLENVDLRDWFDGQKLFSMQYTLDLFLFSCYTGLRLSDLMKINKKNLQDGWLVFELSKNSNRRQTVIKLPLEYLFDGKGLSIFDKNAKDKAPDEPIFAARSRITHQANIRVVQALFFPNKKISIHSARHTFDTLLIEKGVSPFIVQRLLGHQSINTTVSIYDHHSWSLEENEIKKAF